MVSDMGGHVVMLTRDPDMALTNIILNEKLWGVEEG